MVWVGKEIKNQLHQLLLWAGIFSTPSLEHFLISDFWSVGFEAACDGSGRRNELMRKKIPFFSPSLLPGLPKHTSIPFLSFQQFFLLTLGSVDVVLWDLMTLICSRSSLQWLPSGGAPFEHKSSDFSNLPHFQLSLLPFPPPAPDFPLGLFPSRKFPCSEWWWHFPIPGNFLEFLL